ncbi:hypothetical protein Pogu_2048 [Pyrobaculum oguniense TE7]|uniref:Uncharacterized protein n=1 Tax=Pyrobaculum oguniense (strain DSM 13380 / JCM 10595 / TE7) TaxID=698757 RepID=H6QB78_PYROT|nr:hypothetical protein Pogu_2048 [Pyrobaculum oguniense TE7]
MRGLGRVWFGELIVALRILCHVRVAIFVMRKVYKELKYKHTLYIK